MIMSLAFLELGDIDQAWDEPIETKPKINEDDKFEPFIKYIESSWLSEKNYFLEKFGTSVTKINFELLIFVKHTIRK